MAHNVDFHMHTHLSPDGSLHEHDISRALEAGVLHTVAITDHDAIDEALHLQSVFGDRIIVGEEITTSEGEIIGLYLSKLVQRGMSAVKTVEAIREQNGLVYIPHPFEKARKGLSETTLNSIASDVDIIEVRNGRSFSSRARLKAATWAEQNIVAQAASSDAHGFHGWGRVFTELSEPPTRDTLVELIGSATLHGNLNGILAYGYPKLNRFRKRFAK